MAPDAPLSVEDVLSAERQALRAASGAADSKSLTALCLSGGGIRSATFGLGAIQGLSERGLLSQFDYLSTVSGGGYIGSWLTAWINRAGGICHVVPRLGRNAPPPTEGEPDPIQHLREYNSYLSPRGGMFSTDVWTLIATVLRNILLNWMVLIPLLTAALMVPRLYLSGLAFPELLYGAIIFARTPPDYGASQLNAIGESPLVEYVLPALSMMLFATALYNTLRYLPGVGGRDHSRYDYIVRILTPLVGAVLTFLMFDSYYYLGDDYATSSNLSSVLWWTLVPCALAWIAFLGFDRRPVRARLGLFLGPMSLSIAAMAAGTGLATWFVTNFLIWSPNPANVPSWADYVTIGPPAILIGYCLGTVFFAGLSSTSLGGEDREWMSRAVAGVLLAAVVWITVCGVVLILPAWALGWRTWAHGALATVGGLAAWLSTARASVPANANPSAAGPQGSARLSSAAVSAAPVVFIALLIVGLSVLTNVLLYGAHLLTGATLAGPLGEPIEWWNHGGILARSHPLLVVLLTAALAAMSWVAARYVNINTFSLHDMYRDRLVRAYLGASKPQWQASQFTGFSNSDDIKMAALDTRLRPFHVVNLTLNLVAGSRLAWQQRKAASFTVTALQCGGADLGYRPSAEYGGGISLGEAVTTSGAAASPNMGYNSSPVVGFIMTLFNARLGAWLGNPGSPGARTWTHPGPLSAIRSLVKEALGQTSDQSEYVYLSDGGHFENLGLYEMVRRRCRLIVVLDSGCDPDFTYDDLGNALRKIRIDFRIPIEFEDADIRPMKERRKRCAVGTIRYSAVDGPDTDGRLIYLKPMLLGTEPPDVASYAAAHKAFPHESTAEQWFNESQTESYRSMGLITIDDICRGWAGGSLPDLCEHLTSKYLDSGAALPQPELSSQTHHAVGR